MKKIHFLAIFIFLATLVSAQEITTTPAFPKATDEITIVFDATKGNQGLKDYTGDIYAHTGVITSSSAGPSDWKYVIAGWSDNLAKAKMTKLSANLYELKITPSLLAYYNVPQTETVLKMAFVFRSADGTKTGKTATNGDIFADVYEAGLKVTITNPTIKPYFLNLNQSFDITATASELATLTLYIDNNQITQTAGTTLTYNHTAASEGLHQIKIKAENANGTDYDSTTYYVRTASVTENLPANMIDGLNIISSTEATFVLFAPYKNNVYLIGDFNNWEISSEYQMKKTPDGNRWWINVPNLNPNNEYIYQFLIDETLRIADPYTEKISDPSNDQWIPQTVYPNLIKYPTGKTTGIASVFTTQPENYNWQTANFTAPDKSKLVVYELLIRDFSSNGDIKTVTDSLNYLKQLGINAIELMPFSEFEGNDSWGYNPSFYFATDKAYGTSNDYKKFIDECHKNGIAVIMDLVLNHSYGQSPFVQLYFDASAGSYGEPTGLNPWYNPRSPNPVYAWGFDFNHESSATKTLVDSIVHYWLTEYKVDGFRFDFTKGFTNRAGDGWAYDATRIAILKRMADKIWSVNSNAYVILEHLTDNSEEVILANYGMMLWGNINNAFNQSVMGYSSNSDISGISHKSRGWNVPALIGYAESHDEERLLFKALQFGAANTEYNVKDSTIAKKRAEMAAVFLLGVPGPKMIWQFGELGYDYSIDFNGRVGRKPIKWEYYNNPERKQIYATYAYMNKLRKLYPSFHTSDFTVSGSGLVKKIQLNHSDANIVIIGNFDIVKKAVDNPFQHTGIWYNVQTGESITVANTKTAIALQPGEYRIFSDKSPSLFTDVKTVNSAEKIHIYPNPFEHSTTIQIPFTSPDNSVTIYGIDGKLVKYVKNINKTSFTWDGNDYNGNKCTSGTYIINIQNNNLNYSGKVIFK